MSGSPNPTSPEEQVGPHRAAYSQDLHIEVTAITYMLGPTSHGASDSRRCLTHPTFSPRATEVTVAEVTVVEVTVEELDFSQVQHPFEGTQSGHSRRPANVQAPNLGPKPGSQIGPGTLPGTGLQQGVKIRPRMGNRSPSRGSLVVIVPPGAARRGDEHATERAALSPPGHSRRERLRRRRPNRLNRDGLHTPSSRQAPK